MLGAKALSQVETTGRALPDDGLPKNRAAELARIQAFGTWTQANPISVD